MINMPAKEEIKGKLEVAIQLVYHQNRVLSKLNLDAIVLE